jgi:hypothetical protein
MFGAPIGVLLLAFSPLASAASARKIANRNGASAAPFELMLGRLVQWALGLSGFGLTGLMLRSQKPRNNPG